MPSLDAYTSALGEPMTLDLGPLQTALESGNLSVFIGQGIEGKSPEMKALLSLPAALILTSHLEASIADRLTELGAHARVHTADAPPSPTRSAHPSGPSERQAEVYLLRGPGQDSEEDTFDDRRTSGWEHPSLTSMQAQAIRRAMNTVFLILGYRRADQGLRTLVDTYLTHNPLLGRQLYLLDDDPDIHLHWRALAPQVIPKSLAGLMGLAYRHQGSPSGPITVASWKKALGAVAEDVPIPLQPRPPRGWDLERRKLHMSLEGWGRRFIPIFLPNAFETTEFAKSHLLPYPPEPSRWLLVDLGALPPGLPFVDVLEAWDHTSVLLISGLERWGSGSIRLAIPLAKYLNQLREVVVDQKAVLVTHQGFAPHMRRHASDLMDWASYKVEWPEAVPDLTTTLGSGAMEELDAKGGWGWRGAPESEERLSRLALADLTRVLTQGLTRAQLTTVLTLSGIPAAELPSRSASPRQRVNAALDWVARAPKKRLPSLVKAIQYERPDFRLP